MQERVVEHGRELAPEPGEGQADRQRQDVVVEHLDQQPASQPAANVTQGFWVLQRREGRTMPHLVRSTVLDLPFM